jgi:hypothetical protein
MFDSAAWWNSNVMVVIATGLGAVSGCALTLWVKDKARQVARDEFSDMIRLALSDFKEEFGQYLNGRYIYSHGSDLTGAEIDKRLYAAEEEITQVNKDADEKISELSRYSHSRVHGIVNDLGALSYAAEDAKRRLGEHDTRIRDLERHHAT